MSTRAQHYFVPQPSHWMIFGSFALLCMASGAAAWFNGVENARYLLLGGFAILVFMMFRWFGDVVGESEGGKYGVWEDTSFRWGMSWFIFSAVMFFAAFFCARAGDSRSGKPGAEIAVAGFHRPMAYLRAVPGRSVHTDEGVGNSRDQY